MNELQASLEEACARLARLRLELSAAAPPVGEAILANPAAYPGLLRRLAEFAGSNEDFRDLFVELARALGDEAGSDDGYPTSDESDRGCAEDDRGCAEDDRGCAEDDRACAEDDRGESDSDCETASSSDSDIEDVLSDEDAEDALVSADLSHAERKDVRALTRAGSPPWWLAGATETARARGEAQRRWWPGTGTEDDALCGEAEVDRGNEEAHLREMLMAGQDILSDFEGAAPSGAVSILPDEDLLEYLLGPSMGIGATPRKRPRLSDDAPIRAVEEELEAIEAAIEEHEAVAEQRAAAHETLLDVFESCCQLTGASEGIYGAPKAPQDPRGKLLWEADSLLTELEDDGGAVELGETLAMIDRLRAECRAAAKGRPDLKRKRKSAEALDEIRAEQRSTAAIIDRDALECLIREIGHDVRDDFQFDADTVDALQAAAEDYLIRLFNGAGLAAIHADRTFILPKDLHIVRRLRGDRT